VKLQSPIEMHEELRLQKPGRYVCQANPRWVQISNEESILQRSIINGLNSQRFLSQTLDHQKEKKVDQRYQDQEYDKPRQILKFHHLNRKRIQIENLGTKELNNRTEFHVLEKSNNSMVSVQMQSTFDKNN
jgi:hypothetical protein